LALLALLKNFCAGELGGCFVLVLGKYFGALDFTVPSSKRRGLMGCN
jgi:hypothetical protein